MNGNGNDERAVRRDVGRRLLSLRDALSRTLARYDATKDDKSDARVTRACEACAEALREVRGLLDALDAMHTALSSERSRPSMRREPERLSLH